METAIRELTDTARITLQRKIAQGGMSIVYEGRLHGYEGFAKKVAVKMLLKKWTQDDRLMRQFIGEAKLVCDLVHENIVQIYQLGRLPEGDYYILMEYVEGISLRDFLEHHVRRGQRIPEPLAVHIASRVARGLAYAHTFADATGRPLRIVHRDVCPNNILITTEGLTKLIDFGVAKALSQMTIGDNWLTGKARYMAPEQAARKPVDFRADIYALGAVLFEILSGVPIRPPGADPRADDFSRLAIPWNKIPRETGADLLGIVRKTLEPDPARRYQDTNELARALEYHIYKDGYGPTIQTVEAYLRERFPALYERAPAPPGKPGSTRYVIGAPPGEKTQLM